MAKLNLEEFKQNAYGALSDKRVKGLFNDTQEKSDKLPLDQIFYYIKLHIGDQDHEALQQSIERFGLFEPVLVRKIDEGYDLLNGHARVEAMRALGHKEISAKVINASNEEALFLPFLLNSTKTLHPIETAAYIQTIVEEFEVGDETIAQYTGVDVETIEECFFEQDLHQVVRESDFVDVKLLGHLALVGSKTKNSALLNEVLETCTSKKEAYLLLSETLDKRIKIKKDGFVFDKSRQKYEVDLNLEKIEDDQLTYALFDLFVHAKV
jgi:ParB/RepB/Spo0J family partition protein